MDYGPELIVIGGFPGAGKSLIADRLSRELSLPLLNSDTIGGTVRDVLRGKVESPDAFRAGYELLFTLAETFLGSGCSVVVDTNMGWEFQWQRLDAIVGRIAEVSYLPMILRCPRVVAVERITRRYSETDGKRSTAEEILGRHPQVWDYLERLDRPDVRVIDATLEPELVYAQAQRCIQECRRASRLIYPEEAR
jgi:predicted kinase